MNPVLFEFRRAFPGWECDSKGWIVMDKNGKKVVVLTNHGGPYIGNDLEIKDDIARYEELINGAEEALNTLK
jgi:hypothetical protein